MKQVEKFYCYSYRLFHFLIAFDERVLESSVNANSGNRYWTFKKSERLDRVIELYNSVKYNIN